MVWAPDTDWADELIEECAAFPNGDNDDLVDSMIMASMRFRAGNFVTLRDDEMDVHQEPKGIPEYY
jgi:phage terminase large subunit-like protein